MWKEEMLVFPIVQSRVARVLKTRFHDKKNQPSLRDQSNKRARVARIYQAAYSLEIQVAASIPVPRLTNTSRRRWRSGKARRIVLEATQNKRRRERTRQVRHQPDFGANANTRSAFRAWHGRVYVRIYSRSNHCKSRRGPRDEFEIFPATPTQPRCGKVSRRSFFWKRSFFRNMILTPASVPVISCKLSSTD